MVFTKLQYKSFLSNLSSGTTAEWHTTLWFAETSHLNIIQNIFHISYINFKYFISSKILNRVRFIFLMCQLDFLFAVFFPFSFRYFFELLLSSSWLDMTLFHKAARNSPNNVWSITNIYTNNHSFGSWGIILIYNWTNIYLQIVYNNFQVHH